MMVHCITLLHGLMQLQWHEAERESPVPSTQKMGFLATFWEFLRSVLYVLQCFSRSQNYGNYLLNVCISTRSLNKNMGQREER